MLLWELNGPHDYLEEGDWRAFKIRWSVVGLGGDVLAMDLDKSKHTLAIGCGDKTIR